MGVREDPARPGEAGQEGRPAPRARGEMLGAGHGLGPFPKVLGAEQLSPHRPGQQVLAGICARAPQARNEAAGVK
jgi:hypothetical protein